MITCETMMLETLYYGVLVGFVAAMLLWAGLRAWRRWRRRKYYAKTS